MNDAIEVLIQTKPKFFLGPRPGKKSLHKLKELELTHCCTLLSEREEAPLIAKICKKLSKESSSCEWLWLPIEGGNLEILRQTKISDLVNKLTQTIKDDQEPRLYFHCSAGIHRTGFFVYILLRLQGFDPETAFTKLAELRQVTADQVGPERIDLANKVVSEFLNEPLS